MRRWAPALLTALVAVAALPADALAHGLVQRSDLPIPEWLFGWAAAVVLILSFVALAVLWPDPKLEGDDGWRPLPGGVGRVLGSRAVEVICGTAGAFLLVVVIWSGVAGTQSTTANFAPTFVYVVFWVGLVAASVLLGDVFRAFNPWRAIGRAVTSVASRAAGGTVPAPLSYPERLGRWPAVAGLVLFTWLELANPDGDVPRTVAIAAFVYSALTFVGMALYGVEAWIARGEAFSVYFNLFSRIAPFERRDRVVGLRRPLSALARLEPAPGTVALVAVMIGTVTFDGASEGSGWQGIAPDIARFFEDLGVSASPAIAVTYTLGMAAGVAAVLALYRLGVAGARAAARGGPTAARLASAFAHSLVPIALVYVAAHYLTFLLFQGQAAITLASDPLGRGWDLFGSAGRAVDYSLLGGNTVWYLQVGLVVAGHVTAIALAHDRALALYDQARAAVRSQYWMLAVMIGFTTLALWLLSESNA